MDLHNMSVKIFFKEPESVDLDALIPIFHQWIQEKSVEGVLIDVVDYKHVPNGPGLMLIGHECEYSIDMASGRPGLLYRHKRDMVGDLQSRLQFLLKRLFRTARLLSDEKNLPTKIEFHTDELQWYVYDRLQAPNTQETLSELRGEFEAAATRLFAQPKLQATTAHPDPRSLFSIFTKSSVVENFSDIQNRLFAA